jgi:hypothetical protein
MGEGRTKQVAKEEVKDLLGEKCLAAGNSE